MLEDVRQTVIVVSFSWQTEVTVYNRGLRLGNGHSETWHQVVRDIEMGRVKTDLWLQIYIC